VLQVQVPVFCNFHVFTIVWPGRTSVLSVNVTSLTYSELSHRPEPDVAIEYGDKVASVGVTVGVISTAGVSVSMGVSVAVTSVACSVSVWATDVYTPEMLTSVGVDVPPPQAFNANGMIKIAALKIVLVFIGLLFEPKQ
jgi:hypothetical protein